MLICQAIILVARFALSFPHYIPPSDPCLQAELCKHTWQAACGIERTNTNKRLFLDLCDMFEYNCDYGKEYSIIDLNECHQNCTSHTTIIIPETSNHTATSFIRRADREPTTVTLSTTGDQVIEIEKKSTFSEITTTVYTTSNKINMTNRTARSVPATEVFKNNENNSYITNTNYFDLDTFVGYTKETDMMTTVTPTIIIETTIDNTKTAQSLATTLLVTTEAPITILNDTTKLNKIAIDENTVPFDSEKTLFRKSENANTSIGPNVTCSIYPEQDCDRPKTWETTAKGERRDFFQILRDRFDTNTGRFRR